MTTQLNKTLKDSGLVAAAVFDRLAEEADRDGRSLVLALGQVDGVGEEALALLVARHHGLPFAHLHPGRVEAGLFAILGVPEWTRLHALPIALGGTVVTVAAADPDVLEEARKALEERQLTMQVVVAPESEIAAELAKLSGGEQGPSPRLEATLFEEAERVLAKALAEEDGPTAVEALLGLAVQIYASDLHLSWEPDRLVARFRKDGSLRPLRIPASENSVARIISAFKVLATLDIAARRHPQDGRTRVELHREGLPQSVLVRVALLPSRRGEKLAVRILEAGARLMDLTEIGLTRTNLGRVREALRFPSGLFLVTGPTGCGKTTTLYAALDYLAREEVSIFTIEDPIEFDFPGAYQSQVNETIGVTFPLLLRALVRQDPDIVLLGEIRDNESAQTALQAAHSGRLLLSSLHANSACTAVTRLIDMGVEPFVLGSCSRAIIAQRLVRRLCDCKRPVYRMSERLVAIKESFRIVGSSLFEPVGCEHCLHTGFRGRIAVHEVLTFDRELADLVMARATSSQLLTAARSRGFQGMAHDGFSKAFAGLTTVSEVERQVGPAPGLEAC
ncbi:MAG: type II/IV secretion system protein [Candidatus Riflebacteria bacterium]|nr:type II/IV secretion system protein [Candidatus Riflebacteria bacterium]